MSHPLLSQILPILHSVKDNEEMLAKILSFLDAEVVPLLEKEKENIIKIPEKYEALVHSIADSLTAGMVCFLNMETLEVEDVFKNYLDEYDEDMAEVVGEDITFELKHLQWENKLSFEPLPSSEAFRIMEDFTDQLDNQKVQHILVDILSRRKPFANFNSFIHNSNYREDWFAFRLTAYKSHVRKEIYWKLKDETED